MIVALVGGVAWAETQTVATPPGQGAKVVAVMVPGSDGAVVYGNEKVDEHVLFNIRGEIEVNGEVAFHYDAHDTYTVTLEFRMEAGLWVVDTMIENGAGEPVYVRMAHPLERGMPAMITATGEKLISLAVAE